MLCVFIYSGPSDRGRFHEKSRKGVGAGYNFGRGVFGKGKGKGATAGVFTFPNRLDR